MKKILVALLVLVTALPASAVLKESNMEQTLSVLCEELSETHKEQRERAARFEQLNKQFQRSIGRDLELCNNIELMLYSQKEQNVFDLAYSRTISSRRPRCEPHATVASIWPVSSRTISAWLVKQ